MAGEVSFAAAPIYIDPLPPDARLRSLARLVHPLTARSKLASNASAGKDIVGIDGSDPGARCLIVGIGETAACAGAAFDSHFMAALNEGCRA